MHDVPFLVDASLCGMSINIALLEKLMGDVDRHYGAYLKKILTASADYGIFGMDLLDRLHGELHETSCDNCGRCCNGISIFSLEYHRIIRELMTGQNPERLRKAIAGALRFDLRFARVGNERRIRCGFRDDEARCCRVHPVRPFACRLFGMLQSDGTRECSKVRELTSSRPYPRELAEKLQARILDISETFEVFPDKPAIGFFPFEFWLFRFSLGPKKALEIYREIIVPASTPLTHLWKI